MDRLEYEDTLDSIFSAVMIGGMDVNSPDLGSKRESFKMCLPLFRGKYVYNIFNDEYAVLYEIITKMKIGVFTEKQLGVILDQNKDVILDSTVIDFDSMLSTIDGLKEKASDIDKFSVFKAMTIDKFNQLSNEVVSVEEFKSACEIYKMVYKKETMTDIINNMSIINISGKKIKDMQGRTKSYEGVEGAHKYYNDAKKVLDSLDEVSRKTSTVVDEKWLEEELAEEEEGDKLKLVKFGLNEIDNALKYLRRTQILGILGPAKGGKTRTAAYLASKMLMEGLNVCIWPIEGHRSEWDAMILSNIIRVESGISVPSSDIITKNYSEEIKQIVVAAKVKLAMGEGRGRLSYINGTAYLETYQDDLLNHYENENVFDGIFIDSLTLIQSTRNVGKVERISTAYEGFKIFITDTLPIPALGVLTAQLKQSVVDELRNNPNDTIDVTAGGEAAATIRTPDNVIGVFSSKEERDAGLMKMYSVASRHNESFDDHYVRCELGSCYYEDGDDLND